MAQKISRKKPPMIPILSLRSTPEEIAQLQKNKLLNTLKPQEPLSQSDTDTQSSKQK